MYAQAQLSPYGCVKAEDPHIAKELDEAFKQVPGAKELFDSGQATRIAQALDKLREAKFAHLASRVETLMPYKYSV